MCCKAQWEAQASALRADMPIDIISPVFLFIRCLEKEQAEFLASTYQGLSVLRHIFSLQMDLWVFKFKNLYLKTSCITWHLVRSCPSKCIARHTLSRKEEQNLGVYNVSDSSAKLFPEMSISASKIRQNEVILSYMSVQYVCLLSRELGVETVRCEI